jgi:dTDP-glucose 4,6-dehydratase
VVQDLPQDDPMLREPDVSRARELIDWNPKVKREEGLLKSIEYFCNVIRA